MKLNILKNFLTCFIKSKSKSQKITGDFSSPKRQNFSLPYNLILYIADNRTSPLAFEKLQQTCKYFFARQKVLIIDVFFFHDEDWQKISYPNVSYLLKRKYWKPEDEIPSYLPKAWFKVKKLPKNMSFWLINELKYDGKIQTRSIPFILPKIYHISIKTLSISDKKLRKNQFEYLTSSEKLESLSLYSVTIESSEEENYKVMTWFEIYTKLPFLSNFIYDNPQEITNVETILKLHTVDHKVKLKNFYLVLTVSSPFTDILYLWKFMKDNTSLAWMNKQYCWDYYPDFKFIFKNPDFDLNCFRNGEPSFEYAIRLAVPDPQLIPEYDENEFFKNNVIKKLG